MNRGKWQLFYAELIENLKGINGLTMLSLIWFLDTMQSRFK